MNIIQKERIELLLKELVFKSMKGSIGMIKEKELKEPLFLSSLFKTFQITNELGESETRIRMKVQKILQNNLRESIGMFHSKELNETAFILDLINNFKLIEKKDERAN